MTDQSVHIHMMGGGVFHALIGDESMSPAGRTRATYDLIEGDTPIYGSWRDPERSHVDLDPTHATVLHIAGRHAVRDVQAS